MPARKCAQRERMIPPARWKRPMSASTCTARPSCPGYKCWQASPGASRKSGFLGLPEDLVDLLDGVEELLALGRVDRVLALPGQLGGLPEEVVDLGVLLGVLGLEVVRPQHPEVVLDQLGALLLDDHGAVLEDRVVTFLVLLLDLLDGLGLDAGLGRVIDAAGEVAVRVHDVGGADTVNDGEET